VSDTWTFVCASNELLPGEMKSVFDEVTGTPIVVFNLDGELYALEDQCTHEEFELSSGEFNTAEGSVECVLHGARFDVRDGRVVKGVRFRDHVDMGDIAELAQRYRDQGADELVFYDIGASPEARSVDVAWIERIARLIDIPFCVAGGIDSVETARRVLFAGADKVSINSPALGRPELITELADEFGVQCVVVGVDSVREADGQWRVRRFSGDPDKTQAVPLRTLDWIVEAQRRGAGEIVLNCMDSDGVRRGYDVAQLQQARALCQVPLIASGGAGAMQHFAEAFDQADVDGALAASVFHSGAIAIPELKRYLRAQQIEVRDVY